MMVGERVEGWWVDFGGRRTDDRAGHTAQGPAVGPGLVNTHPRGLVMEAAECRRDGEKGETGEEGLARRNRWRVQE